MTPTYSIQTLDHFVLTVADIGVTVAFYTHALGMTATQFDTPDGETRWMLKYGSSKINLHQRGHEFEPKAHNPTPGSEDLCFLTDAPLDGWLDHLGRLDVTVEQGPVARTGAIGPLMSIYIRDPDRNLIEISVQA